MPIDRHDTPPRSRARWPGRSFGRLRSGPARLRSAFLESPRVLVTRQVFKVAPGHASVLTVCALTGAVMPNVIRVSLGVLIGHVRVAARDGFSSGAGRTVIAALAVAVVSYLVSLLVEPVRLSTTNATRVRLTYATQERLMAAVSDPAGIGHLENRTVLNRLAAAQGQMMAYFPADAAATLAQVVATRLGGVLACAVLAWFKLWLGLLLLVMWSAIRRPLRQAVVAQVRAYGGEADVLRRAAYFRDLAMKPPAAKEMRIFGLTGWAVGQFRDHWLRGMHQMWRVARRFNVTLAWLAGIVLAVYLLGVGAIAMEVGHHRISLTAIAVILPSLFATAWTGSVSWYDVNLEWMVSALPALRDLETQLIDRAEVLDGRAPPPERLAREIRLEHVGFRYEGASADVFSALDMVIPAGMSTALVGANGAGKTTLVKLISRLLEPSSGRILIDGTDLREIEPRLWQRKVAVVFQDFTRFPFTAEENVSFGAIEDRLDSGGVQAAARTAGAESVIRDLPDGWQTTLAPQFSGGVDLSGGQWQRIALARALFAARHKAALLVLDEPTAWLDAEAEADFFDRFLEITENLTTVIVSHRFATVRRADRICVLGGGQVVEQGSHDELYALGGEYAHMFDLQAARFLDREGMGE